MLSYWTQGMEARDESPVPMLCGLCTGKGRVSFLGSEEREMNDQKFIRANFMRFSLSTIVLLKEKGVGRRLHLKLRYFVK